MFKLNVFQNFFAIYKYNHIYQRVDQKHKQALLFQVIILIFTIFLLIINYFTFDPNNHYFYLDQFNRIYALLVGLLTAVLVSLNSLDKNKELSKHQFNYTDITFKEDFIAIIMYTLFLFFFGLIFNVLYAIFFQYFHILVLSAFCWFIQIFILFDSLFFTIYTVDELSDLIRSNIGS